MSITLDPRTTAHAACSVENASALGRSLKEASGKVALVRVAFAKDYADRLNQKVDAPTPPGGMPAEWSEFVPEIGSLQAVDGGDTGGSCC